MAGKRNLSRFKAGVRLWALLLLTAVALWPAIVRGQAVDFARRLQDAIDQTESELEAEKARITKEEQDRQKELDENRAVCRKLADEIVERKISIARKQAALRQVRGQRETLWAERTQWREDLSQIRLICGEVERELRELVGVLPVSEDRRSQLGQLANIEKALAEGKHEGLIEPVFAVAASLLHETRSTAVYSADVVDPAGLRRSARLLRVGLNLFGYHIADTSQTAIAICDPYQEGGFRWREGLGQPMVRAVISAIEQAQTHSGVYPLPIDVTGAMTAPIGLRSKTLIGRIRSGGVVMFPLAAVAVFLVVLISERFIVLLSETRHSLAFCERILDMCGKGDFEQAEQLAGRAKGVVSRTLNVCLAHRNSAPAVLDDAIQETFLHEFPKLERFLPSIRMLSSVAPILGLLGTVTGIIATFDMITVVGGGKPQLLAGGISEALITTATGLIIAIPGLLAHSFLSGKINSIIAEAERFAASLSNLIKQHQNTVKGD